MNRLHRYAIVSLILITSLLANHAQAEPQTYANGCIATVSQHISRWSEGGFLPLNEKDILLAVTGYTNWNHDHSPANIYGFWSHDGGISWTPQENAILLQDAASLGHENVMSVSLLKLQSGDVLMTFFTYKREKEPGGMYVKRSSDLGKNWTKPICVHPELVSMPGRSFQLATGRIIVPVAGGVAYSDDDGKTFNAGLCPQTGGNEASVVELKDGRLLLFMRNSTGQILKSYSTDKGQTWSTMQPTGILCPASMNTLTRLQNGDIMLIFNMARDKAEIKGPWPRHRLCTMISTDEGMTWHHPRLLDGGNQYADVLKITMASAVTLGPDTVLVAWSRSPMQSKEHYRNLYDYRFRKFNLDWLYAEPDSKRK